MSGTGLALYILTLCLYFAAAVVFLLDMTGAENNNPFKTGRLLLIGGLMLLTLLIFSRSLTFRYLPLLTFHETLLLLAWVATLVVLALERAYQFKAVYSFMMPLLFLALFLALFFAAAGVNPAPELRSGWLISHIVSVIMAYGTFAVSFVVSIMYLVVDYYLKKKKISSLLLGLPSLDSLDFYIYRLVTVGFFLLTVSIILGAMWANTVWGEFWRWEPKEIWAAVTWIIYAAYLHTRLLSGWQGRKVALLNSFGFATVLFNYVFVRFFLTGGMHRFF
ncbi:MAG: c-type cytochrome biogenesis protein CcsB [Dethiobacter sp.]|jgi:cytochrome c-type biogenesis protein CcsB|nr:c-type cytochrome biogenesis protein CcsB [Dethiobacter sp.]